MNNYITYDSDSTEESVNINKVSKSMTIRSKTDKDRKGKYLHPSPNTYKNLAATEKPPKKIITNELLTLNDRITSFNQKIAGRRNLIQCKPQDGPRVSSKPKICAKYTENPLSKKIIGQKEAEPVRTPREIDSILNSYSNSMTEENRDKVLSNYFSLEGDTQRGLDVIDGISVMTECDLVSTDMNERSGDLRSEIKLEHKSPLMNFAQRNRELFRKKA